MITIVDTVISTIKYFNLSSFLYYLAMWRITSLQQSHDTYVYLYTFLYAKPFAWFLFVRYVSDSKSRLSNHNEKSIWISWTNMEHWFLDAWRPHENAWSSSGNTYCRLEIWDLQELGLCVRLILLTMTLLKSDLHAKRTIKNSD